MSAAEHLAQGPGLTAADWDYEVASIACPCCGDGLAVWLAARPGADAAAASVFCLRAGQEFVTVRVAGEEPRAFALPPGRRDVLPAGRPGDPETLRAALRLLEVSARALAARVGPDYEPGPADLAQADGLAYLADRVRELLGP